MRDCECFRLLSSSMHVRDSRRPHNSFFDVVKRQPSNTEFIDYAASEKNADVVWSVMLVEIQDKHFCPLVLGEKNIKNFAIC